MVLLMFFTTYVTIYLMSTNIFQPLRPLNTNTARWTPLGYKSMLACLERGRRNPLMASHVT